MIDAVKLSEPKREVILLQKKLLARATQDQPSQRIRPQARRSVLLNLPTLLRAMERRNVQLNLQIRPGKGKKGEFQKGKKDDYEKGKSKKDSSKGSFEKGKSKHYSKGQK